MNYAYTSTGRGDQCMSADGTGLPIAPLLLDPDEIASGEIGHALRLYLPADLLGQSENINNFYY